MAFKSLFWAWTSWGATQLIIFSLGLALFLNGGLIGKIFSGLFFGINIFLVVIIFYGSVITRKVIEWKMKKAFKQMSK